ncbi:tetratricopeptide repeat protein [Variovorax terrae]|uniref:Tetratricopeptide repeat protein n=1 Tax=Variovorax terrae TaxID=2923278 RepID=A0A9X2ANZ0_9BURK|nr:tetratricopeptide repeat protein [Variovorax terrae]MCJ0765318.1 tetratricopeptide repeat protein [Variovorax terrae]
MKRFHRLAAVALAAAALAAQAQVSADTPAAGNGSDSASPPPVNSNLDAELFYELLLGELNVRSGEPGAGYSLVLDAARRTRDSQLFQRAVEIALQSRSGDAALQASRAWQQTLPESREANRYVLQILIALNRLNDSLEPLKNEVGLAPPKDRALAIGAIPRHYARAVDKKLAASVVEQALTDYLGNPATGSSAWTTVGRMRLAAADTSGALDAVRSGQAMDPRAEGPVLLALELMDLKVPQAEPVVKKYLEGKPLPELRMAYARVLLDAQRYAEASGQLQVITAEKPDFAEAWLVQGTLQMQDNQPAAAETSFKRFIELAKAGGPVEERSRALAQAYLSLAQIAEQRKDYAGAEAWLNRIDNPQALASAQTRRASILARQGKLDEARRLIRGLPERNPAEARSKLMAEVQLLRDNKQYQSAYELLRSAQERSPTDSDLLYDQAMLAEKLGNFAEMERLLRQLIAIKPDYHHAYNALGYSLAERGVRLPEARDLIRKALEYAPGDPFISDSLGWVEFRMGNQAEALRILDSAYQSKPDPEIAAHLGEVLWALGQRERAVAIWKEGLLLNANNEALQETLKRLRVKL